MERTHLKIAEFAGAGFKPAPTPLRSRKPTRASGFMPETAARHLDLASPPKRAALGAAPRQGPRAGRQVDLPPRAHLPRAPSRPGSGNCRGPRRAVLRGRRIRPSWPVQSHHSRQEARWTVLGGSGCLIRDLTNPCQPTAYLCPKAEDGNRRKSVLQRARQRSG